jgi:hypothetical protein
MHESRGAGGCCRGGSVGHVEARASLRRLYVRLAEEFGWTYPEIDAVSIADANEIVETWNERAAPAVAIEPDEPARSGPITAEEFARIEGQMRSIAATDKRRSPWA